MFSIWCDGEFCALRIGNTVNQPPLPISFDNWKVDDVNILKGQDAPSKAAITTAN